MPLPELQLVIHAYASNGAPIVQGEANTSGQVFTFIILEFSTPTPLGLLHFFNGLLRRH